MGPFCNNGQALQIQWNYMHLGDPNLWKEEKKEPHHKEDPGKNMIENTFEWDQALPIALPQIRAAP